MRQDAAKPRATDGRLPVSAPASRGSRPSRWRWIVAGLLIAAVVAICGYAVWVYAPETFSPQRLQAVAVVAKGNETYLIDKQGNYVRGDNNNLLRITGVRSSPKNPPGSPWGDPLIEAAVQLADLLHPDRAAFQLTTIELNSDQIYPNLLRLHTRGGNRIIWGQDAPNEPSAHEKIERLRAYYDSPQYTTGPWQLDLQPPDRPLLKKLRTQ